MHQNHSSTDIRKMKHSLGQMCGLGALWGGRLQTGIKLQWLEDTGQGLHLCDICGVYPCPASPFLRPPVFQRCQPRGHSGHTCLPCTTYMVIYHSSISIFCFVPPGWEHWAEEPRVTSPGHLQRLKLSGSTQGSYSMSKFGLPLGGIVGMVWGHISVLGKQSRAPLLEQRGIHTLLCSTNPFGVPVICQALLGWCSE